MEKQIYNETSEKIIKQFDSDAKLGLTDAQIATNRNKYGNNSLAVKKPKTIFRVFLEQYKDILMIVLLVSALVSLFVGIFPTDGINWGSDLLTIEGWENFILIVGVTLINAILGTVQVIKSRKSLDSLKKLTQTKTKVIRNGVTQTINSHELVVGDLIIIEAGDLVPSDARLLTVNNLRVNESSLTGESLTISKTNKVLDESNLALGDQINMVFSGCLVTFGRAYAVVTAVGAKTEIGKINKLLDDTEQKETPLQTNLNKLAKILMYTVLVICGILFALNISKLAFLPEITVVNGLATFTDSLNFSIALAVAVIPEALSSIVTIVLSISTKKLSKHNAIVKNLKAVEGLGSVSVICSDKTGTLTLNKMSVTNIFVDKQSSASDSVQIKNENVQKLMEYAVLCSDATIDKGNVVGDPTEVCLIEFAHQYKINSQDLKLNKLRISEIPFDSDRMMMSTLIKHKKENIMVTKGAIDKMLSKMTHINHDGKIVAIKKADIEQIKKANDSFTGQGERVLCFGYKPFDRKEVELKDEKDLIFLGLIAMIDPPRPEVIKAVQECYISGIKVVMITGDHLNTACAIGKQIGIFQAQDWAMSGQELTKITEAELTENVMKYSVYARVSPEDKIKIVRAWQAQNMIISMTGDGVNDAPALKQADIGVAMGITGTEVSKDAASIILTDDNFATIVQAIKFGRSVYNNIKSAIKFLLTGNLATIFVAIVLTIFSMSIHTIVPPFIAIQLLFLNLLTDSWPAISLGLEKYRNEVIYEKPRKANESFLNKKFSLQALYESLIMTVIVLAAFFMIYYLCPTTNSVEVNYLNASGMAFITLAFCRFFHGFNCKQNGPINSFKIFFDNWYLTGSLFLGIGLMSFIFYTPGVINVMFSLQHFIIFDQSMVWIALGFGALMIVFVQILKRCQNDPAYTKTTINIPPATL